MKEKIVFVLGIWLLYSVSAYSEEHLNLGVLVKNGAEHLSLFDLDSKKPVGKTIEGIAADSSSLSGVSKLDEDTLLISYSERRGSGVTWIYKVDINRWSATKITKGEKPVAIKGQNKFMFISKVAEESDEHLFLANMDKKPIAITKLFKISVAMHNHGYLPVQVSQDKVVVAGPKGDEHQAYEVDINSLKVSPSPIGKCIPSIWFKSLNQLLCWTPEIKKGRFLGFEYQTSDNPYYLTNLDGSGYKLWNDEHIPMEESDFDTPLHYVPEIDTLFIRRARSSIGYGGAIYAYDMKDKKETFLFNSITGRGGIEWIKKKREK